MKSCFHMICYLYGVKLSKGGTFINKMNSYTLSPPSISSYQESSTSAWSKSSLLRNRLWPTCCCSVVRSRKLSQLSYKLVSSTRPYKWTSTFSTGRGTALFACAREMAAFVKDTSVSCKRLGVLKFSLRKLRSNVLLCPGRWSWQSNTKPMWTPCWPTEKSSYRNLAKRRPIRDSCITLKGYVLVGFQLVMAKIVKIADWRKAHTLM